MHIAPLPCYKNPNYAIPNMSSLSTSYSLTVSQRNLESKYHSLSTEIWVESGHGPSEFGPSRKPSCDVAKHETSHREIRRHEGKLHYPLPSISHHITSHHPVHPPRQWRQRGKPPVSTFHIWILELRVPFFITRSWTGSQKKGNKREKLKGKGTDLPFTGLLSVIWETHPVLKCQAGSVLWGWDGVWLKVHSLYTVHCT